MLIGIYKLQLAALKHESVCDMLASVDVVLGLLRASWKILRNCKVEYQVAHWQNAGPRHETVITLELIELEPRARRR